MKIRAERRERSGCSSLLLQVENKEVGLKRAGKLGVACPLVEVHLDSWDSQRPRQ